MDGLKNHGCGKIWRRYSFSKIDGRSLKKN